MKKLFSLLLAFSLLLSLGIPALAAGTPTLVFTGAEAVPGEEVTLTLSILNSPGLKGLSAELVYDESALTLVSAAPLIDVGTWMVDTIADDHLLYWYSPTAFSGEAIANVTFRVAEDAPAALYEVGLRFGDWDGLYDASGADITDFSVTPAAVTLPGPAAPETYTVSYDPNGGSGAPEAQSKTEGEALTLSALVPTRASEVAGSYALTLVGAEASEQPENTPDELTLTLSSVTAAPGEEITLSLSILNSPGLKGLSAELVYDEDALTLVSASPLIGVGTWMVDTIADDHLLYWYSPTAYSGEAVADISFRVAQSAPDGEYAVGLRFGDWDGLYGASGDELSGFAVLPGAVTVGGTPANLTAARTAVYRFTGWNTAANGSGTAYAPGASYTEDTDVTLYAQWSTDLVTEALTLPDVSREDFLFLGWGKNADGEEAAYQAGESFTPNADTTLYAVWLDLSAPDCVLPDDLETLEDEALSAADFRYVRLPDGAAAIGSRVFDGCNRLAAVYVPASVTVIAPDAFDGAPMTLALLGSAESAIAEYAAQHGFRFEEVNAPPIS